MKKIKFISSILLFSAAVIIMGCGDKQRPDIKVMNQASLTQTVYADETYGERNVTFVTSGAWSATVTEGADAERARWISIDPFYGDGGGTHTIDVSLEPNVTVEDRKATIIISCNGMDVAVTVTQKAKKEDGQPYAGKQIVLTVGQYGSLSLGIGGSGRMTINWGDGKAIETYMLRPPEGYDTWGLLGDEFSHWYAGSSEHTTIPYIEDNSGSLHCDPNIAKEKGWSVYAVWGSGPA